MAGVNYGVEYNALLNRLKALQVTVQESLENAEQGRVLVNLLDPCEPARVQGMAIGYRDCALGIRNVLGGVPDDTVL